MPFMGLLTLPLTPRNEPKRSLSLKTTGDPERSLMRSQLGTQRVLGFFLYWRNGLALSQSLPMNCIASRQ